MDLHGRKLGKCKQTLIDYYAAIVVQKKKRGFLSILKFYHLVKTQNFTLKKKKIIFFLCFC